MRLFVHQVRADQLIFWRSREAAIFVFVFPILLFVLLSTVYTGTYRGHPLHDYLLPALLGYGVVNTTFGGLAILLVIRREEGILKRIRATPLPPPTYLAGVIASILLVFALQAVALALLGRVLYSTGFPSRPFSLMAGASVGAAAFAAMGVGLSGLIRSAEGASPIVNVIVLPMTFLAGGFGPTRHFPHVLQVIADVLPLTYLIDVLKAVYLDHASITSQASALAVLAAWGLVGVLVALRKFRWEPREA